MLTKDGLQLIVVMPGIDIQKDIIAHSPSKILIPVEGVSMCDFPIITGQHFHLKFEKQKK
jgi:acyl CoA:acetate/3-ketoacid CoA transferase